MNEKQGTISSIELYIRDTIKILEKINRNDINNIIKTLIAIRKNDGRLFFIGLGGGAGNSSHAVNDFRKIAGIESYTPADNVSELTARANDEGWNTIFSEWLKQSRLTDRDGVFVFSVGGGSKEKNISVNIVYALEYAKEKNAKVLGIVGRDGGYTAKIADACCIIPTVNTNTITAHTESFQCLIWHLIVADPRIMRHSNKWESTEIFKK